MKTQILPLIILLAFPQMSFALSEVEKDKILFMIFEAQNRKLTPPQIVSCKTPEEKASWYCTNNTVKKYLMSLYRVKSDKQSQINTTLECNEITNEMQKNVLSTTDKKELGDKDFRREVSLSLKGQWLCFFKAEQKLLGGKDNFDDPQLLLSSQSEPTLVSGLSFVMNKDKNRVVSKQISSWWTFH